MGFRDLSKILGDLSKNFGELSRNVGGLSERVELLSGPGLIPGIARFDSGDRPV